MEYKNLKQKMLSIALVIVMTVTQSSAVLAAGTVSGDGAYVSASEENRLPQAVSEASAAGDDTVSSSISAQAVTSEDEKETDLAAESDDKYEEISENGVPGQQPSEPREETDEETEAGLLIRNAELLKETGEIFEGIEKYEP
ncbi:MAG: hypothetical protein IJ805_05110, partial [Lachnospiraceae bacterium]|nr:hypothetical protein [Lachnospiraceae bacterium]